MKKTLQHYSACCNYGWRIFLNIKEEAGKTSTTNYNGFGIIASFIFIVFMTLGSMQDATAQGSFTWNGGGSNDNMTTGVNWGGTAPGSPQVFLNFAGNTRLTPFNNFNAGSGGFQIFFKSGAGSFTIGGNLITFYNYGSPAPLIQNEGTALQTINFPISNGNTANNGDMNINGNGSGGPITFGSTFTTPNGTNNRTLKINNGNGSGTVTFNGAIGQGTGGGKLAFAKNGANSSAILGAANTYTGNTDINAGTLFINGSTSSSSPVTVLSGATLAGNGTAAGSVTLSGIVSPGATSATTANLNTGAFTFNANSSYRFEMNNATGTAGNASGWDKITSTGAITCSASPITLNLVSLSVSNFNPANAYTWPIASASSISGFNASNFTINTASFASFTGIFSVTLTGGNTINLVYLPPSSGPAQPSAISGPTTVCNGTSQTYSVTNDINATSYQWTLPSGWSGTSSTNSITVTVANPSGSLSVVAQNAGGDSFPRSVFVNVGVSTSITTQPSTSAQSVCLGGSVTALSVVAAGSSLTYQWYSNTSQTNSGGTLITGATSSSYTPTAFGTPLYYYCTVGGSCAPTSVSSNASGLISISGLPNDTATYTISNGGNGGQGFGPWAYSVTGGSGGTFTEGNGSNVQIGQAWGLYANGNGITSASRAFVAPMAIGNNVSFAFDNGGVDAANSVGVRLRNASNGILMEFRFLAGASEYSIYDGTGVANTGVTFTTTGLSNVSFAYTGVNTYAISITKAGVTTTINGRTFATVSGGQVPAAIEFFNSNAGIGATKNIYFNALTMGYPKIFVQPVISVQNVCQNGTATTLSVVASGSNLGYQWYSNPGAVLLGGQTASTFSPPTDSPSTKTYYCVVSYTGSCGTVSSITSASSGVVTVFGLPTATISGTATVCATGSTNLQVAITGGTSPFTVVYSDGTSNFTVNSYTSGANISVTPAATTTYSLVSVTSTGGCVGTGNSGTPIVTVNTPSTAAVLSGTASICVGGTTNLQVAITGGTSPFTVVYSNGTSNFTVSSYTSGTNIPVSPTSTKTYSLVSVTSTGGCAGTGNSGTPTVTVDPGTTYYADTDTDGFGDPASTQVSCSGAPSGYVANNTDCAPADSTKWQIGNFYTDADNDGYNNGAPLTPVCYGNSTPSGYAASNIGTDCLDSNAEVNPNHVEVLSNGIDDNCDGNIDEVAPTSSLQPSQCGITLTNIAQAIYANVVTGAVAAQGYRFEVTEVGNPSNVRTYDAASNSFNLGNLVGGGVYNTTYSIRVAVKTAPGFWRAYAAACTVSTPAVAATTKVQTSQCGITLTNIDATIYCDAVSSATGYRFRVTDGVTTQTYDTTVNRFSLTSSPLTASFGTTYSVDVQLKFGTTWETTWGTVCNITTPLTPGTSNVSAAQCGTNITNLWATIYATQIAVATGYRFEVTKAGGGTVFYDTPNARFSLRNITVPGFTATNASYSIRVAILFNSVYQGFGSACTITTTGASRITNNPIEVFEVKAYPNPFAANFKLDINTSSEANVSVKVYDMIGREIEARQANVADMTSVEIGNQYPTGVYNIVVTQGDKVKSLRVIKR